MTVAIVDAGLGNVKSVRRMIHHVGGEAELVDRPGDLSGYDRIILPGVGAFDHGMSLLDQGGWIVALDEQVMARRRPVLGICLGMQLMTRGSEEGVRRGLGWIAADVHRLRPSDPRRFKVPHIGWSTTLGVLGHPLFAHGDDERRFYYVHGYHAVCDDPSDVIATADHDGAFVSAFAKDNVMGVQFHPEKSHRFGMALMRAFLAI